MSTTTLLAIIASSWGIAMALSPTLQIRHMIARRSSAGISIPYLGVLVSGSCSGSPTASRSTTGR